MTTIFEHDKIIQDHIKVMKNMVKTNQHIIKGVDYFSQRDNRKYPYISCYPTSMGMAMNYCLQQKGLDKTTVGCGKNMQLEDYINEVIYDHITKSWMIRNTNRLGKWIWKYKRRTIGNIEEYVFNRLMEPLGFRDKFVTNITYDQVCEHIKKHKLPMPMSGNFKSVSRVGNHIVCAIGFSKWGLQELICHDPYGSALKGYPKQKIDFSIVDGTEISYPYRFFKKNRKGHMWAHLIEEL